MKELAGKLIGKGMSVGILVSRFNDFLTKQLVEGAKDCLLRHGVEENKITIAWVPGSNELPMAAAQFVKKGKVDAIIALGVVIDGATAHADLINTQVSRSLAQLALDFGLPVINGVVAAHNIEQAIERCGTKSGNKGWQAALAAIEMVNLYHEISELL